MKLAYLGIPGSFSYAAAQKLALKSDELINAPDFKQTFELLVDGIVDRAVVPIENTLAGSIYENYDLLHEHNLYIAAEVSIKVEHCLLVSPATKSNTSSLQTIKTVYSHPKALEQCSIFLDKHPGMIKKPYSDTAGAAAFVGEQKDPSIAAIASSVCAKLYGLEILASSLENNQGNYTRFLSVSRDEILTKHANKCSLIVYLPHKQGSLGAVFNILNNGGCNLTKIESRPIHDKPFEYIFYLDFVYDSELIELASLLKNISENVLTMHVLGTYMDART